jgi:hypothetical protein
MCTPDTLICFVLKLSNENREKNPVAKLYLKTNGPKRFEMLGKPRSF